MTITLSKKTHPYVPTNGNKNIKPRNTKMCNMINTLTVLTKISHIKLKWDLKYVAQKVIVVMNI